MTNFWVHIDGLVAHQLARFGTGGREAHSVDHVVEAAFQKLQQSFARGARPAGGLLIIIAELALEHAVHAAQLLLLAQLQTVLRQALLAFALHAAPAALRACTSRLQRLHAALEEQIGSLASRQLALRTGIFCHYKPLDDLRRDPLRRGAFSAADNRYGGWVSHLQCW